jgi:energy-coupling factor transporter ATP-binding protein EcfA2
MFGGGLPWRPHMWIVGPSGAGKSTLQTAMRRLLGSWAIFTEDATEAGLRQLLNKDTLGVMFDEFEPSESNKVVMDKVVRLARLASSGASALRGSTDHKAAAFVARSCFLFSSVQYQALEAQDRNRIAIVTLSKIPDKTQKLKMPAALEDWGDQLRRRVIEQWHRFDNTLAAYAREMFDQGFSAREQDTYGVLLACADMVLHDGTPDRIGLNEDAQRCAEYVRMLEPSLDRSRGESEDNATRCLRRLASQRLQASAGKDAKQVSEWVGEAFAEICAGIDVKPIAMTKLISHGMAIVVPPDDPGSESAGPKAGRDDAAKELHVAIAGKDHQGITEIFAGSLWAGGMWAQTLATIPGARASKKARLGANVRCVTVPLAEFIDLAEWRVKASDMMTDARRV